jgi:hypothetical protein
MEDGRIRSVLARTIQEATRVAGELGQGRRRRPLTPVICPAGAVGDAPGRPCSVPCAPSSACLPGRAVWAAFSVKLGRLTFADHMDRIGQTPRPRSCSTAPARASARRSRRSSSGCSASTSRPRRISPRPPSRCDPPRRRDRCHRPPPACPRAPASSRDATLRHRGLTATGAPSTADAAKLPGRRKPLTGSRVCRRQPARYPRAVSVPVALALAVAVIGARVGGTCPRGQLHPRARVQQNLSPRPAPAPPSPPRRRRCPVARACAGRCSCTAAATSCSARASSAPPRTPRRPPTPRAASSCGCRPASTRW